MMTAITQLSGSETLLYTHEDPLDVMLKIATADIHKKAERHLFVTAYYNETPALSDRAYCSYLSDTMLVYSAIEKGVKECSGADMWSDPVISPLDIPEINRTRALENDLKEFSCEGIENSASAIAYFNHIIDLKKPHLLLAHCYVNYLRDLFGGQIIKKYFRKIWPTKNCCSFLDFPEYAKRHPHVKSSLGLAMIYKEILKALPLTREEKREVIGEAFIAFEYSIEMMDALCRIPNWNVRDLYLLCKKIVEELRCNSAKLSDDLRKEWSRQFATLTLHLTKNGELQIDCDKGAVAKVSHSGGGRVELTRFPPVDDEKAKTEFSYLLSDLEPLCEG